MLLSNDKINVNIERKEKVFFEDGGDKVLDEYDKTPLYFATQKENIEIAKLMLTYFLNIEHIYQIAVVK